MPERTVRLEGQVVEAATGLPLAGAHVRLLTTSFGAATDSLGRFSIAGIAPGFYTAEAGMLGFETRQAGVEVQAAQAGTSLFFSLADASLSLSEIVVTPGRFSMQRAAAGSLRSLSSDELNRMPNLSDDIYRAVQRMPGLSGSDYSARFTVRGGEHDEVLVTLDGLELQDPFHLKDIGGGALSIVDVEAIGGVDLMTGAFTAEYGNRLSGVFALTSIEPDPERIETSVGISLMNARVKSQGTFNQGAGSWLVLGRRGYMDLLLQLTSQSQNYAPRYYDGFARITHRLGRRHTVSLQALGSRDDLQFAEEDEPDDRARTSYGNGYVWSQLRSVWSSRLYSETVLSLSHVAHLRRGVDTRVSDGRASYRVYDHRSFMTYALKQDWQLELGDRSQLKWGVVLRNHDAFYRYSSADFIEEAASLQAGPAYLETRLTQRRGGTSAGGYGSFRQRLGERLIAEAGLRYDAATWSHDRHLSPRLNAGFQLDAQTTLLAGWGYFHQTQGLHELMLPDPNARFYPAERAEHRVLGLSRVLGESASLRVDVYQKRKTNLRPRFVSLIGDATNLFPEIGDDRIELTPSSGSAEGIEILLDKKFGSRFNGWLSYALSRAEDRVDGRRVAKRFDQRHTFFADASFRLGARMGINLTWQYHTGWRYTAIDVELVRPPGGESFYRKHFGPLNEEVLPAYHRLDVRIQRDFSLRQSTLEAYIEVRNAYNRKNIRLFNYLPINQEDDSVLLIPEPQTWLPIMPAFGLQWNLTR
ncbi:MAG: TonB-dependent receptor [Rhodothermales bacterium]